VLTRPEPGNTLVGLQSPIHKREFFRLAVRKRLTGRRVLLRLSLQKDRIVEDRHDPGSAVPFLRRCLFDVHTAPTTVVEPLLPGFDILPTLPEVTWQSDQSRLNVPASTPSKWFNSQAKTRRAESVLVLL
jgi:hypothetical protein